MIDDLLGRGPVDDEADFIVIGAGTVGLPTSVRLARETGRKVVCLESGSHRQIDETHPLNEVVHLASRYDGAEAGRFRCLGGTSTRWGGALVPFQAADLEKDDWPISLDDLSPYLTDVESLFGIEAGPYIDTSFPFDLGSVHVNRLAKWPPFHKRNVARLLRREMRNLPNLKIRLNATATEIHVAPNGKGVEVIARSLAGDQIRLTAPRLIIAAGAIETTRLALLIDRQNGGRIRATSPSLGRYFSDHISVGVADIVSHRQAALNKVIGFRFGKHGTMCNIRFELAGRAQARRSLPASFVDIRFDLRGSGGFDALRAVYRKLQAQQLPAARTVWHLMCHFPWLMRAAWWRFVNKRLLFPHAAHLVAHAVIAQTPDADNFIALSSTERDPFGVPLAEIKWRVSETDIGHIIETARLFQATWRATGLADYSDWQGYPSEAIGVSARAAGGFLHPTGSTRMARDPGEGVVDRDLRLFAMPQVQLLSTSVLPSAGGANPTMMVLLLAMRCVDQHVHGASG